MTQSLAFGRVAAAPGKHGPLDMRVTFAGEAPTLAEVVALVGFTLLAEDRYRGRDDLGRRMLWAFLDRVSCKWDPEGVLWVARQCDEACR